VKKCIVTQPDCQQSAPNTHTDYACPNKGRYPHPEGVTDKFIFCKDAEHEPCWCACEGDKLYDHDLQRCRRRDKRVALSTKPIHDTKENVVIKINTPSLPPLAPSPSSTIVSSHLVAKAPPGGYIRDDMPFPTWAIALVVLLVVILGMLVILILY
jgi:hypothetical protein